MVHRIHLVHCLVPLELFHRLYRFKFFDWLHWLIWQHLLDWLIPQRLQCSQRPEFPRPHVMARVQSRDERTQEEMT